MIFHLAQKYEKTKPFQRYRDANTDLLPPVLFKDIEDT